MEKKYTKLSELVGKTFTIEKAWGYSWKKYDPESKRMLLAEKYEEGFRKVYSLDTDQGKLDVGSGQLSSLLEAVYSKGTADINGKTFEVKSNGKTGMDIRYFFNVVRQTYQPQVNETKVNEPEVADSEVDEDFKSLMESIPF
jgi:hypothetical protein